MNCYPQIMSILCLHPSLFDRISLMYPFRNGSFNMDEQEIEEMDERMNSFLIDAITIAVTNEDDHVASRLKDQINSFQYFWQKCPSENIGRSTKQFSNKL